MIWKLGPRAEPIHVWVRTKTIRSKQREGSGSGEAQWGGLFPGSWREKQHQHQSCGLRGLGRWRYLCVYLLMGVCDCCMCVHIFYVIAVYVAV